MYKVIGQFTPNIELVNETEPHRFDKEYDLYSDAMEYYCLIISEMASNIADIGGEFVTTMIGDAGDGEQVIKRHVVSTTTLLL